MTLIALASLIILHSLNKTARSEPAVEEEWDRIREEKNQLKRERFLFNRQRRFYDDLVLSVIDLIHRHPILVVEDEVVRDLRRYRDRKQLGFDWGTTTP